MGFHRQGQPAARNRVPHPTAIARFVGEQEIAHVFAAQDPFRIDDLCTLSPDSVHQAYASCGEVVCVHCSKVFW
jgi:hypothetical protein